MNKISFRKIIAVLVGFSYFLKYKTSFYIKMLENAATQTTTQEQMLVSIQNEYKIIKMQQELHEDTQASNLVLKNSINNLFDLIPDQITLNKVFMEKNSLTLYGEAPSKNSYNMLLAPPLKSIFDESQVKFFLKKKGWYSFVSTNQITVR